MPYVLSELAEQASQRVMTTLALERVLSSQRATRRKRIGAPRANMLSTPARYLTLPHLVAVVEDFARNLLLELTEQELDLTSRSTRALFEKGEIDAESSWDRQGEAWREWHGIRLSEFPRYGEFRAFLQARNAIMHGSGRLTRKQVRKDGGGSVRAQLKGVGIGVVGLELIVTTTTVERCAGVAREFIRWLDEKGAAV